MFAEGVPWSEIDALAQAMSAETLEMYMDMREMAIAAGYDPLWTAKEHLVYENHSRALHRVHELTRALGRSPSIADLLDLPENPYTGSSRVSMRDAVTSSHGWSYDPNDLNIRAVIPIGERCRSINGRDLEYLWESWIDRAEFLADESGH